MAEKLVFKVGGVPEHFNIPWYKAMENDEFSQENFSVSWKDYPGGTGAMAKDLRSGALDLAVLLTEGIIADIAKGNPSKIISLYVSSPLIWGIHVPAHSNIQNIEEIRGKKYAISRKGSGSHLMAHVDAKQRGWYLDENQFVIVGDLKGAREAFRNNKAEVFMWEKFMTQPLVDQGEFRRVGECPTPWPAFVIAARNETIKNYLPALKSLLSVIEKTSTQFKNNVKSIDEVSERYGIRKEDAAAWFAHTEWACGKKLSDEVAKRVIVTLEELSLIGGSIENKDLLAHIRS